MNSKQEKCKRGSSLRNKFNTLLGKEKKETPSIEEQGEDINNILSELDKLSEEELNKQFDEELLDDISLTEEKKIPFRQQDFQQKKQMLAMHHKSSVTNNGKNDQPEDFIQRLKDKETTGEKRYELVMSLRVALANNPLSWVKEFGGKGLDALLENLNNFYGNSNERRSTQECLKCIRFFTNNNFGLLQVINHKEALTILSRSIDTRDPGSMFVSVQLIAAFCLVPPDGHNNALAAITALGEINKHDRFMPIIQGLKMDNPQMKVVCMQFINSIISSPDDIDVRMHLRFEFLRTGLIDVLGSLENVDCEKLKTQLDVFHDKKDEDFEEFSNRLNNHSNSINNKLNKVLIAKQEIDARVSTLEEKLKQCEAKMTELKALLYLTQ